jgi:hypothetical protein
MAVAGYRQVLEEGPDACDSESDSEHFPLLAVVTVFSVTLIVAHIRTIFDRVAKLVSCQLAMSWMASISPHTLAVCSVLGLTRYLRTREFRQVCPETSDRPLLAVQIVGNSDPDSSPGHVAKKVHRKFPRGLLLPERTEPDARLRSLSNSALVGMSQTFAYPLASTIHHTPAVSHASWHRH